MSSLFMSSMVAEPQVRSLTAFANEPYTDFSDPVNRTAMEKALAQVRSQFGREYELLVAGRRVNTGDLLKSLNPSKPSEVIGVHHKATADFANESISSAHSYFEEWAAT